VRITSTSQPSPREGLTYHVLDDEALIYDARDGGTHRLNCTARFIWEHCDGSSSCDSIALKLTRNWDAAPARAKEDVLTAVNEMVNNGLLEVNRPR